MTRYIFNLTKEGLVGEEVGGMLIPDFSTQHICPELAFPVACFQVPPIYKTPSGSAAEVSEDPLEAADVAVHWFFLEVGEERDVGPAGGTDREMAFFSTWSWTRSR